MELVVLIILSYLIVYYSARHPSESWDMRIVRKAREREKAAETREYRIQARWEAAHPKEAAQQKAERIESKNSLLRWMERRSKRDKKLDRTHQQRLKHKLWAERSHVCELCGMLLRWAYTRLHHLDPPSNAEEDLALYCANCHAIAHKGRTS